MSVSVQFEYTEQSNPNLLGIGTQQGGYICQWDPFNVKIKIMRQRGIYKIAVWELSNLVVFLEQKGDKKCYVYDSHRDQVWDVIMTKQGIESIMIRKDMLFVQTKSDIQCYLLPKVEKQRVFEGVDNPYDVVMQGDVIKMVGRNCANKNYVSINTKSDEKQVKLHDNVITNVCFNKTCNELYASCSEKGTIVRVWRSDSGKPIWEGRRGLEPSRIHSIDFKDNTLVVGTLKGSVHYFNTDNKQKRGYLWTELPRSNNVWRVGKNPFVQIINERIMVGDASGLISIYSIESGDILYQTSLIGDSDSPFAIPLA